MSLDELISHLPEDGAFCLYRLEKNKWQVSFGKPSAFAIINNEMETEYDGRGKTTGAAMINMLDHMSMADKLPINQRIKDLQNLNEHEL